MSLGIRSISVSCLGVLVIMIENSCHKQKVDHCCDAGKRAKQNPQQPKRRRIQYNFRNIPAPGVGWYFFIKLGLVSLGAWKIWESKLHLYDYFSGRAASAFAELFQKAERWKPQRHCLQRIRVSKFRSLSLWSSTSPFSITRLLMDTQQKTETAKGLLLTLVLRNHPPGVQRYSNCFEKGNIPKHCWVEKNYWGGGTEPKTH